MAMDSKIMSLERSKAKEENNMHGQPISILKEKYHSFPISFCGQVSPPLCASYAQLTPRGGIMEKLWKIVMLSLWKFPSLFALKIWFDFLSGGKELPVWLDYRQTGLSLGAHLVCFWPVRDSKLNHVHFAGHDLILCLRQG